MSNKKRLSTLQWRRGVVQAVIDELQLRGIAFQLEAGDLVIEDRFEDFVLGFVDQQHTPNPRLSSNGAQNGDSGQVEALLFPPGVAQGGVPAPPLGPKQSPDGQGMAIAGLVCGIVAFLLLPIVLGPLGIIFGAITWNQGNKLGKVALIVSICGLVIGMLLGAATFSGSSW